MRNFEKRLIEFIERGYDKIFVFAGVMLALLLRICAFDFISSDMSGYLVGWFGQIEQLGRINALSTQVGNYSVAYQTLIVLMTYIPIDCVYQYKFLSVFFDFSLAAGIAETIYRFTGKDKIKAVYSFLVTLFLPTVFINSAVWGQCDSIYASFIVWALLAFSEDKYKKTFILYGLACAFKLQAIFVLPFFLFAYVTKKSFSILHFFIVPAVMEFITIPAMLMGRSWKAAFSVYYYQTESCDNMFFNYPSLWNLISDQRTYHTEYCITMKVPAIILAVSVLMMLMYVVYKRGMVIRDVNILKLAMIFVYTCVIFLPGMHERYGYVYEILALMLAFLIPHTIPLFGLLIGLSCITYGHSLFGGLEVTRCMSALNIICYVAYLAIFIFDYKSQWSKTNNR